MSHERWRGPVALALLVLGCGGSVSGPAAPAGPEAAGETGAIPIGQLASGELPAPIPVEADDLLWGEAHAPVTLVEFIDYQCPFCVRAARVIEELKQHYGPERLQIAVKHLPLPMHPDATGAAVALQAVKELAGDPVAWQYGVRMMAHQRALGRENLATWAEQLGVERKSFLARIKDPLLLAAVEHDLRLASRLGISGTPAFRINGRVVDGAYPFEHFQRLIDEELGQAQQLLDKGLAPGELYSLRVVENLQNQAADISDVAPDVFKVPIDGSPVSGSDGALVTIVEFSDFECPFCRRAQPTLERLRREFPGQIRVVFKHLPLDFHERALPASRLAAEAQTLLGDAAFFEIKAKLFDSDLLPSSLVELGVAQGLTQQQAQGAVEGSSGQSRVDRDGALAATLEVSGTPQFFVNGRRLVGAQPYPKFEALVKQELDKARERVGQGLTTASGYYAYVQEQAGSPTQIVIELPTEGYPKRGPDTAPVKAHVFSDFECPFCARVEPTLEELLQRYPEEIQVVWHNLPLPFHSQAALAAEAAMEAYAQAGDEAFWKLHALMFQSHTMSDGPRLTADDLIRYAGLAGLDVAAFSDALKRRTRKARVTEDVLLAEQLGISATPSVVINGRLTSGARPLEHFERVVKQALAARALDAQDATEDPSQRP